MAAPPAGIDAWRWFRVLPAGELSGAQDVAWPAEEAIHARHVGSPLMERPSEPPLCAVVWQAVGRWRRAAALGAVVAVVAAGWALDGAGLAASVLVWVLPALIGFSQAARARRILLGGLIIGLLWFGLVVTVALLAVSIAALGIEGSTHLAGNVAALVVSLGMCAVLGVGARSVVRGPSASHVCPARPKRLGAAWAPQCGIYGYRTVDDAIKAASAQWFFHDVVVAQVKLWGRCFEYEDGWRAEWARVEAVYDDGSGRGELPAVRYRVPLVVLPEAVTLGAAAAPAAVSVMAKFEARVRAWAAAKRRDPDG